MSLVFDGLILIVCIIIVVVETRRGFVKSVMHLCSHIAALFVAYAFTPRLSAFFNEHFFLDKVSSGIRDTLKSLTVNSEGSYDLSRLLDDIPEPFTQILTRYNKPLDSIADKIRDVTGAAEDAVNDLADHIAGDVAGVLSSVCAFLLLFIASLLVLKLVTFILDALFRLPILSTANTALGFIFGVVIALIAAFVLSLLSVKFIGAMSSISPDLFSQDVIDKSIILKFFAKYNILGVIAGVIR